MDKNYIISLTQKILNKEFSDTVFHKINTYEDRINFRCPYCREGKSKHKKRGNIYFNRLVYICFRCDKKTSLDKFVTNFHETIDPQKKLEMIQYLESVIDYSDYDTDFVQFNSEDLFDMKDLEELFNAKDKTPIFDFKPVVPNGGVYKYLIGRGIPHHLHRDIYQAKFQKGDEGFEHIIVFLNRKGDKIISLQVRNLKSGKRRFFVIYNWESIWKWFRGEEEETDMQKTIIYNKLSLYFNILNVDFDQTITIFEGFLDSLFYPNSIGVVGVNTDLSFLENNNIDLQYFFDNDSAGFRKSEEKLLQNSKVFLWNKLFDDIIEKKKGSDPYKLLWRIQKVKDLNKLAELVGDPLKKLELQKFFSEDVFDLKWIPKPTKFKPKEEKDYIKEFKWKELE